MIKGSPVNENEAAEAGSASYVVLAVKLVGFLSALGCPVESMKCVR